MKSFRDRNPYLVGIVSVLLIGGATGFAFMVGLLNLLENAYEMEGVFSDASGLRTGDDVKVAGVKVGRVTDIEVDRPSGNVRVSWVVNDGIEVGSDTGAEIALASLLGAKHIRLIDPMAGDTMMDELPPEQRVVPLERTKVPFDLFELTRVATEGINELETEKLNDLLVDLADITDGKAATVEDLLTGIREVGSAINERDQEFADLLDQADRLSATLADKDDEIISLLDTSQQILDLIVERRNDLAIVLGESADAVQELNRVISANKAQIDGVLDSLSPTLDVVSAQQDDIDRALAWLGPGLLQQSKGGAQGPWADIFVRSVSPDVLGILNDVYTDILGLEAP
ncbi:MCE family protein [Actinospongicola halichondriae]|uniref:MCE family protein n=1 Tax=Actinospongicola halichondriae TaxID=3236844 RepID=UPI003D49A585